MTREEITNKFLESVVAEGMSPEKAEELAQVANKFAMECALRGSAPTQEESMELFESVMREKEVTPEPEDNPMDKLMELLEEIGIDLPPALQEEKERDEYDQEILRKLGVPVGFEKKPEVAERVEKLEEMAEVIKEIPPQYLAIMFDMVENNDKTFEEALEKAAALANNFDMVTEG